MLGKKAVNVTDMFVFFFCLDLSNFIPFQEPITKRDHLPCCVCETAFSQVELFLDKTFVRITNHKRLLLTSANPFPVLIIMMHGNLTLSNDSLD